MRWRWPLRLTKSRARPSRDASETRCSPGVGAESLAQPSSDETSTDLCLLDVDIRLHSAHFAHGSGKLMPLAAATLDLEIEKVSRQTRLGTDQASREHSYSVKISGSQLIVYHSRLQGPALELNLFMSKVVGKQKRDDGLPCFALSEGAIRDAAHRTWGDWWLFTVSSDSALSSVLEKLLASGAVLKGVVKMPPVLVQMAEGTRSSVYLARVADVAPFKGRLWDDCQAAETPGNRSDTQMSGSDASDKELTPSPTLGSWRSQDCGMAQSLNDGDSGLAVGLVELGAMAMRELERDQSRGDMHVKEPLLPEGSEEENGLAMKVYNPCQEAGNDATPCERLLPGSPESLLTVDQGQLAKLATELKMLSLAQGHKHVVRLIGFAQMCSPKTLEVGGVLLTEYCNGGTLTNYIRQHGHMAEPEAASMMHGLLSALSYLHAKAILHRNVSVHHIILRQSTGEWVLCGFGSACWEGHATNAVDGVGTIGYVAPEVLASKQWTPAADVFSAGCVLYFAHMKKNPFGSKKRPEDTQNRTCSGHFDFETKSGRVISHGFKAYVRELLNVSIADRPSCLQACNNPWFHACGFDVPGQVPFATMDGGQSSRPSLGEMLRSYRKLIRLPRVARNLRSTSNGVTHMQSHESMLRVGPG